MSGSTLSGTLTVGVTLDVTSYFNGLTLTRTAEINPTANETDGVYVQSGTIVNYGSISGSSGGDIGGIGVDIVNGLLTNSGTIAGGASSYSGDVGLGGAGLEVSGATVSNSGLIIGGVGASAIAGYEGGVSGAGLSESSGLVTNISTIVGGAKHPEELISVNGYPHYILSAAGPGAELTGGSLLNQGLIIGGYNGGDGAKVNGGIITNDGRVVGGIESEGVQLTAGTLINNGSIIGGAYFPGTFGADGSDGLYQSGGEIINNGLIAGSDATDTAEGLTETKAGYGAYIASGTILNFGTINAGSGGINNSEIQNIRGDVGLVLNDGTLINGGLVKGGTDGFGKQDNAVTLVSSLAVVIADPGAAFTGSVAGSGDNLLELAAGTPGTAGTLDMGGSFSGFGTIVFGVDAAWTLAGTTAELANGQKVVDFASPDTLLLEGFTATCDTYVTGAGLELSNGATTETIDLVGSFSTSSFLVTDSADGTNITLGVPVCYLSGTRIATPAGEVPIEGLSIGDTVITRFNGYRRIKWIGQQSFSAGFIKNNRDQIPVCIHAGALGPNLPYRDLSISSGHSMLIGGSLILARNLVNGVTITQHDLLEEIHYYQLEFDSHDCVLAEGTWSESFCDYAGLRNQFHNAADFRVLYPNHITPTEHKMCAPRPEHGPALAAALAPIVTHAAACTTPGALRGWIDEISPHGAITGWAQDTANPELPVLLEILLRGRRLSTILACDYRADLAAASIVQGRCAFTFNGPKLARRSLADVRVQRFHDSMLLPMNPQCLAPSRRKLG